MLGNQPFQLAKPPQASHKRAVCSASTGVNYDVLEQVGEGTYAHVFLGFDGVNGRHVALKVISLVSDSEDESHSSMLKQRIEKEIIIQKNMRHSNIVSLYDTWCDGQNVLMVLEYAAGGELFDKIRKQTFSSHTLNID